MSEHVLTGGLVREVGAGGVEGAVAQLAEGHLVVRRQAAGAAALAGAALPRVLAALAHRVRAQLHARRVD